MSEPASAVTAYPQTNNNAKRGQKQNVKFTVKLWGKHDVKFTDGSISSCGENKT